MNFEDFFSADEGGYPYEDAAEINEVLFNAAEVKPSKACLATAGFNPSLITLSSLS